MLDEFDESNVEDAVIANADPATSASWERIKTELLASQTPGAQQANTAIALAERYCDSCLSHSAEERMTMLRFTMWVREQQHP